MRWTWQRRGNGINRRLAGCRLDLDVRGLLAASGLTISALETCYEPGTARPAGSFHEGCATA